MGDPAVAAIAARQEGVISTAQLRSVGLDRNAVTLRVRQRRLHRLHRGVHAVGHTRLTWRGRLWAAVLACGGPDLAAVSHRSAAALWDLAPPPAGPIDVTTLGSSRSTPAIHVHRSRTIDPERDIVRLNDGLATTTPARTLVDLAGALSAHATERVCHRAQTLRLLDAHAVEELLSRAGGRRTRGLKAALASLTAAGPDITRSELEERFLALVAQAGLPKPEVNATVAGCEVDFLWRSARLIVETDGASTHLTPQAFEEDRRRDAALQVAGFRVVRFTWRQVTSDPKGVVRTLRALLS